MNRKPVTILTALVLMLLALASTACRGAEAGVSQDMNGDTAEHADAAAPTPQLIKAPHQMYDASTQPAPADKVKTLSLTIEKKILEIAPGVPYDAWTFNGTMPGPVLRVRQGDQVNFTLINNSDMEHSIDFHAAQTAPNLNYRNIKAGEKLTFSFTANYPGVYMYHCGTAPALAHIANGMYGAIIVEPAEPLPPAREYVLVQSEFYTKLGSNGAYQYDGAKTLAKQPDYVVFNGYANQYKDMPLKADPGERVRIWVLNAGPSEFSAFHVVGAIFDKAYPNGNPKNVESGMQTITVPPGGGYMVEFTMADAGVYPFVTHSFADVNKGAVGILQVGNVAAGTTMSH